MSLERILRLLVQNLEDLGIGYMLIGSLASSFHGDPRATQDIDLVIDGERQALDALGARLRESGFYADAEAINRAAEAGGMFSTIDPSSGWKVDFILLKDRAFSRSEFDGGVSAEVAGLSLSLVRPDDMVVAKLEWAKLGESDRQLRDVLGIPMVQGPALDRVRIERWVEELGLQPSGRWSSRWSALRWVHPKSASIRTGHTFSSAVSVMGSYPAPVRMFTGTSLKENEVNTVPLGERVVAPTRTRTDPRRLDILTQSPSSMPHAFTSSG